MGEVLAVTDFKWLSSAEMKLMLPLDSPRWAQYGHAYGKAGDVPGWLRELESGDTDEARGKIWSALWHQGGGYSAAFLAIPHLVRILENQKPADCIELLGFVAITASWFDPRTDFRIDPDICEWYESAIQKAGDLALDTFNAVKFDQLNTIYLMSAIAGLKGCRGPGRILSDWLTAKECELTCPACHGGLYVGPSGDGFETEGDTDPVTTAEPRMDALAVWDFKAFDCENSFVWLTHLALQNGHEELGRLLRYLYGWITYPVCSTRFNLIERLIQEAV